MSRQHYIIDVNNQRRLTPESRESILDNLDRWAQTQEPGRYQINEPSEIDEAWTKKQLDCYWGMIDEMVRLHGEYLKRGYHFIMMWECGYGDDITFERIDQTTGEIIEHHYFNPMSMTKIGKRRCIILIDTLIKYAFEAGVYMPTAEEWKSGKRAYKL